jgi:outer membrane protein OmpA-like peptidoglycan-associated protein
MVLTRWTTEPRVLRGLTTALVAASLAYGCGGPGAQSCPLEGWSGMCGLTNFTKVREVEFPVPHAVYEAIYTPLHNPQSPNYTPPALRLEVTAVSKHEQALHEHMTRYSQISCQQSIKEGCAYNPVVANLPKFNPDHYAPAQAQAAGPQGCEKIEAQGVGPNPEIGKDTTETLPERFLFPSNDSAPDASMTPLAQSVAQRLNADPSIECVGVVGQSAAGESPGLGELRAQAIKRLLLQHGVTAERMMTISASTPLYGPGNERQPAKPEDQRVSITVILRAGAGTPAPPPQ